MGSNQSTPETTASTPTTPNPTPIPPEVKGDFSPPATTTFGDYSQPITEQQNYTIIPSLMPSLMPQQ